MFAELFYQQPAHAIISQVPLKTIPHHIRVNMLFFIFRQRKLFFKRDSPVFLSTP